MLNVGEYLKENGIKPSIQRIKIFQYLLDHHTHPTIIEDNEVRYDVVMDTHGHFKCTACGEIIDFDIDLSKLDLMKLGNVEVEETHFYLKGKCSNCLKTEKKN